MLFAANREAIKSTGLSQSLHHEVAHRTGQNSTGDTQCDEVDDVELQGLAQVSGGKQLQPECTPPGRHTAEHGNAQTKAAVEEDGEDDLHANALRDT